MTARLLTFLTVAVLLHFTLFSAAQSSRLPQRIISAVPAVTQMLYAIGAGPQLIAVSSFDRSPEAAALPRIGALLDPDMERMFSLQPDLVILYGSQIDETGQLTRAQIPVFTYRHGDLGHVTSTMRLLGKQTGHTHSADTVAATIERDVARLRVRLRDRPQPRTLLVFGREPDTIRNVYASGGMGFLHDILEAAGGTNVLANVQREAAQPSSETILALAPDVIIELRAEATTENEIVVDTRAWEQFSALPAVQSGHIYVLTGSELVIPGPRVADVIRRIAQLLHPGAF
jgi:iron complex transport system substrate-binding protein